MPYLPNIPNTLRKPLSNERVRLNTEHPLNQNLVAWYLLNAGSGLTVRSVRGTIIRTLALTNGPVWTPGPYGMQLLFDDASDQYCTGSSPILAYPMTLAGWAWHDDLTISTALLAVGSTGASTWHHYIGFRGAIAGDYIVAASGSYGSTGIAYEVGKLYFVVGLFNGTNHRQVYVNGIPGAADTTNGTTGFATVRIGKNTTSSAASSWSGGILDCAIWNRLLSDQEIMELYKYYYGRPSNPRLI